MKVEAYNELNECILKNIKEIETACREYDGLKQDVPLEISFNFYKDMNSIFMAYEGNRPVSMLIIFMPTSEEAEISAYTIPQYRQRGLFRALLAEAYNELKKYNVIDILFVCEGISTTGKKAVLAQNALYEFTEYYMVHDTDNYSLPGLSPVIALHRCSMEDVEDLIPVSQSVFNDTYENAKSFFIKTLEDNTCEQYAVLLDNRFIGMGSIQIGTNQCMLCGLGIIPEYRGKGFGKELLHCLLESIITRGMKSIALEVNSTNQAAFELYKKSGFKVESSYDYYSLRNFCSKFWGNNYFL